MIRITSIAAVSAVVYVLIKKYSSEYAPIVEIAAVILLIWTAYPYLCDIIDFFGDYMDASGVGSDYSKTVLKTIGTALITQFSADICRDSGQTALASKVEFAGKTVIIAMTLPIIKAILELAYTAVNKL